MRFKISNHFLNRLSIQPTLIVFFFQMSVGSDSELNENDKDPHQQSMQENEIDICEEILKDVDNILNEFPDVPEFNFQLIHHILILIPIPSINLFFQLTH